LEIVQFSLKNKNFWFFGQKRFNLIRENLNNNNGGGCIMRASRGEIKIEEILK
jgi:hypothetical protein